MATLSHVYAKCTAGRRHYLQTSEPADLKQFLDKRPLSPSCMPIGWSSHCGAKQTVFRCQAHHEETACAK